MSKHTKQGFKFRSQPGSRVLSQLLRQQKAPSSCRSFTRRIARRASASHAADPGWGWRQAAWPRDTLLQKEKCLCPGSPPSLAPPASRAQSGKPGGCMPLSHFWGKVENRWGASQRNHWSDP